MPKESFEETLHQSTCKMLLDLARKNEEGMIILDGLDAAILGVVSRCGLSPCLLYSSERIVRIFVERDGMSREEAEEFFDFNTAGAYLGEQTPLFLHDLECPALMRWTSDVPPQPASVSAAGAEPDHRGEVRVVVFVRTNHQAPNGVETLARLQLRMRFTDRDDLVTRLRKSVDNWTRTTDAGRRVRQASSDDTNIGDLASYGVLEDARDAELDRLLAEQGLHEVRLTAVQDNVMTLPYDTLLIRDYDDPT